MNSLEAFKEARWIMEQYHKQFVKEGIELKTVEGYPLDKIEKDLELLEILCNHLSAFLGTGENDSGTQKVILLRGIFLENDKDYQKIEEWLDYDR